MTDLPQLTDFKSLLLSDTPMIDTRAPIEFAKGSFPNTVKLPLMTDMERERVGTCYKRNGPDAAVKLGHELVSGEVKKARVQAWADFVALNPNAVIYCFRGGMRSSISQTWLAEAGVVIPRVTGGYKALRAWLLNELDRLIADMPMIVLAGKTGAAKTEVLNGRGDELPVPGSVDLEGHAHHRGSAFGKRLGGQPSQIDFENAFIIDMLKAEASGAPAIILEDESRLIGRCSLPPQLQEKMKQAPLVLLESSLQSRVDHSFENYILDNHRDVIASYGDTALSFHQFAKGLLGSLDSIARRLGGDRHTQLRAQMLSALNAQQNGDASHHKDWIEWLLVNYYDPMYEHQLENRRERVIFSGDRDQVRAYFAAGEFPSGSR